MIKFRIFLIFGTRPELIKLWVLIKLLQDQKDFIELIVINTNQHKDLLRPFLKFFNIEPNHSLHINISGSLPDLISTVTEQLESLYRKYSPNLTLVQGDTASTYAGAFASFLNKVPVFHIEAGLRSGDSSSPFPEEMLRKIVTQFASKHFAPTAESKMNLLNENVIEKDIFVVGNTGIDSLRKISQMKIEDYDKLPKKIMSFVQSNQSKVYVTIHRRENFFIFPDLIINAIKSLSSCDEQCIFLIPIHPNGIFTKRNIKDLKSLSNVILCNPLDYAQSILVMRSADVIWSDSGGLQEEAPYFKTPLLILRNQTERPEAISNTQNILIGNNVDQLIDKTIIFCRSNNKGIKNFDNAINFFGDGYSSRRILDTILSQFGI
jgi:UDP-N-acetylglucosamine 2-epimerase (non-hydrolysing)